MPPRLTRTAVCRLLRSKFAPILWQIYLPGVLYLGDHVLLVFLASTFLLCVPTELPRAVLHPREQQEEGRAVHGRAPDRGYDPVPVQAAHHSGGAWQ